MKKFWSWVLMVVVASCLAAGSALAAEPGKKGGDKPRPSPEDLFKKLDTDKDGKLTLAEFVARAKDDVMKEKLTNQFKAMDKENKGALTLDEFKAGFQRHGKHEKKPEKPQK